MQNEPNFKKVKMNATPVLAKNYNEQRTTNDEQNEPNTNPILRKMNPISNFALGRDSELAARYRTKSKKTLANIPFPMYGNCSGSVIVLYKGVKKCSRKKP